MKQVPGTCFRKLLRLSLWQTQEFYRIVYDMTVPDIFLLPFLSSERCPSLFKRSEMLLFKILCQE